MTQHASFTGVLYVILILLVASYLFRLFFPYILKFLLKKVERKFTSQFQQYQQDTSSQNDGANTSKQKPPSKKNDSSVGEYIEFEEID